MRVTDRGRQQTWRNEPERYETRDRSDVCHNADTPLAIPNPAFLISEVQSALTFIVMHDAWRLHPLTWIHRSEARRIARELRHAGHAVQRAAYRRSAVADPGPVRCILRLSDPVMFEAVEMLSSARVHYVGPGFEAMKRCYDKYAACRLVAAAGLTCPQTALGTEADRVAFPLVLKPRWGSDSIGLRLYTHGPVPAGKRNERHIVQRRVRGEDITIAILNGEAGAPLHIRIPDGALYTFARKYVLRPRIVALGEQRLAERVRVEAVRIAAALGADWAARIDFIHEADTGRLHFLECDVAPLIGPGSAFETSLSAGGLARSEQLKRLFFNPPSTFDRGLAAAISAER